MRFQCGELGGVFWIEQKNWRLEFFLLFTTINMAANDSSADEARYTVIVEHLDPELEEWQVLEYKCITDECASSTPKWQFLLSGLPNPADVAKQLGVSGNIVTQESVESRYSQEKKSRVCLLDPKATKDLEPEDGDVFDVFLFGGILGDDPPRGNDIGLYYQNRLTRA